VAGRSQWSVKSLQCVRGTGSVPHETTHMKVMAYSIYTFSLQQRCVHDTIHPGTWRTSCDS